MTCHQLSCSSIAPTHKLRFFEIEEANNVARCSAFLLCLLCTCDHKHLSFPSAYTHNAGKYQSVLSDRTLVNACEAYVSLVHVSSFQRRQPMCVSSMQLNRLRAEYEVVTLVEIEFARNVSWMLRSCEVRRARPAWVNQDYGLLTCR